MKFVRQLYDWTLSWAESKYGLAALAMIAFAESSFFPIPPDVLLIALSLGKPKNAFLFALVCTASSVAGGVLGHWIGSALWTTTSAFFFRYVPGFTLHHFETVQNLYQQNAFWAIFIAAFTPIPYKVFTVAAGVFSIPISVLMFASVFGRGLRFFLVSALIYFFGPPIKNVIDKYFDLLTILFLVLLIGGFYLVQHLVHR